MVTSENFTSIRLKDIAKVSHGPATRRGLLDKEGAEVVGGVAAATINLAAGYTITKTDADNYTFATGTTSSITETGGGGFASAGPVTVTA